MTFNKVLKILTESIKPVKSKFGINYPDFNNLEWRTKHNAYTTFFSHESNIYKVEIDNNELSFYYVNNINKENLFSDEIISTKATSLQNNSSIIFNKVLYILFEGIKNSFKIDRILFQGSNNNKKLTEFYENLVKNTSFNKIMSDYSYIKKESKIPNRYEYVKTQ